MDKGKTIATLQEAERAKRRAKAFETLRSDKYPVDPNFRWVCMDTRVMRPQEMATHHLFNALKMMWNHNVPEDWIIQPFTHYPGVRKFPKGMRKAAISNLFNELMNRSDRTVGMESALRRMAEMLHTEGKRILADRNI